MCCQLAKACAKLVVDGTGIHPWDVLDCMKCRALGWLKATSSFKEQFQNKIISGKLYKIHYESLPLQSLVYMDSFL